MGILDDFSKISGLNAKKQNEPSTRKAELQKEYQNILGNQLTLEKVKEYVVFSQNLTIKEMSKYAKPVDSWLSLICFIIPFIGIIRKWYQDQKKLELEVQLRVYTVLEDFLTSREKRLKIIQEQLSSFTD